MNSWKPDSFSPEEIKNNMDNKTFLVPKFQRGIVWSENQRNDLIDTIKKGLPFGSLLLYKTDNKFQIIDGLQRSTAVVGFVQNPSQFFNEDDIEEDAIRRIVDIIGANGSQNAIAETVRSTLIDWVKEHDSYSKVKSMQFAHFGKKISSKFPSCLGKEVDIGDIVEPMLERFKEICETINGIKIPAIVLEGPDDQLALLFERINSKGTQLSKYEIYAASWVGGKYLIDESLIELVKLNRDRYDSMLDGKADIEDYDSTEFLNNRVLNPFEIAFGLGKFLCEQYPHLFGLPKEETVIESIGFTLINTCLGQQNKDTIVMNGKLKENVGEEINIFIKNILECVKYVDRRIGKYNTFKSNSRNNSGKRPLHSDFQICAIVSSIFLLKYADIELDENESVKSFKLHLSNENPKWKQAFKKAFDKNVAKSYIAEILQKRWANAGDRKLDQVIITPEIYTRTIEKHDFELILDNWFQGMNSERYEFTKVSSPKEPELLLLAAVYLLNNFSANLQLNESKFDIEHLATKQSMKERLSSFDGELRLPISSFGNLCLLPEFENRSKGKKTIYQDNEYLSKSKLTIEEVEKNYSFTKRGELDWLLDTSLSREDFADEYYNFITNRFKRMKRIIIENYDKL